MAILPASDGDVVDNNGAQFYDAADPGRSSASSTLTTRTTTSSTGSGSTTRRRRPADHVPARSRTILSAYGCAFFRAVLLGHPTVGFLDGTHATARRPRQTRCTCSFKGGADPVDDHEDGNGSPSTRCRRPPRSRRADRHENPFTQTGRAVQRQLLREYHRHGRPTEGKMAPSVPRSARAGTSGANRLDPRREVYDGRSPPAGAQVSGGVKTAKASSSGWTPTASGGSPPARSARLRSRGLLQ